jgi:hypothetical protein
MNRELEKLPTDHELRGILMMFWNESLDIEQKRNALVFAMPVTYPDKWQVVLELTQGPNGFCLSDRGHTLLTYVTSPTQTPADMLEEDGVLRREYGATISAEDIQTFAEDLAAIVATGPWRSRYESHSPQ